MFTTIRKGNHKSQAVLEISELKNKIMTEKDKIKKDIPRNYIGDKS